MKVLFSYFIICCFATTSFSQNISYGILGGLNISNSDITVNHNGEISNRDYYDNRVSFYIGGSVQLPVTIKKLDLFLSFELIYSQQGYIFKGTYETDIIELNQLNLPITLKHEVFKNFYFGIGGYAGYILEVKGNLYGNNLDEYDLDLGVLSVVEYKIVKNLNIELKYLFGLSDVLNREFNDGEYKHNNFNRVLQIGLNYKF